VIARIISGGQTGVDRAALDAARALGINAGGWVPRGRLAEDGRIPDSYHNLIETDSADASMRTEWNVRDASATLLITRGPPRGGSALTRDVAQRLAKPLLHIDVAVCTIDDATQILVDWLRQIGATVLNVAGSRASQDPEIYEFTKSLLCEAIVAYRR
jgi:hypothetical protein